MFTGIVQKTGTVVRQTGGRLILKAKLPGMRVGQSLAVNGTCLTIAKRNNGHIVLDLNPETLKKTNLGTLRSKDAVNLEPPLRAGDFLGGHWVSGHVEACATLLARGPMGRDSLLLRFSLPARLRRYVVEKGSIAVDGVSLTVNSTGPGFFECALIPHTLRHTTLNRLKPGDAVNLETDLLARHLEKLLEERRG